jgi:hypothetical protein
MAASNLPGTLPHVKHANALTARADDPAALQPEV